MEAGRATLCSLCFIALVNAIVDPYENQPMLESQNGHLFIVGASGANITLKTRGGGQVNINGENVLKVVDMALSAAQKVDKWVSENTGSGGESQSSLDTFVTPLTRRVELIEASIANGTSAGLLPIVNRLTRDVKSLRQLAEADDCKSDPCFHGGSCQDLFNDFRCSCLENWEGKTCQKDVDECERFKGTDLGCQNGATCQNLDGAYRCICTPPWYGLHCTKLVHTCETTGNSLCGNGVCIENKASPNAYICQCSQGWTLDKITGTCTVDVDECASKISPCSHDPLVKCENLPGSFKCDSCPAGYVGNGYQCRDVDECATSNGGCSTNPLVQCINTRGSRVCGPCPPGYSGDGATCSRTDDLCQVNHGGCHPLADCIHNPGLTYVQCKCPHGYAGSGVGDSGCVRDNSTALYCTDNYCQNGGTCSISFEGIVRQAPTCICLPYFTGSRCETHVGLNACSLKPCQNNGTCISIPGGIEMYKCLCEFGFTGDKCQFSILGCGGTYRSKNGTLTWPMVNSTDRKFPSSPISCQWTISAPQQVLNITIRANISCAIDFLRIHDGRNSEYPAIKICGYKRTFNVTTTWNVVHIIFETLYRIPVDTSKWPKFIMKWTSVPRVCGGEINATQHGTLMSPGWPGYYPHQLNCVWHLKTQLGKRIQFTFFSMDVESHAKCRFDHLKIFDGPEITSPELAVLCNKTIPPPITTSSYTAALHFVTDEILTGKGWQLAYTPIEGTPGCGGILNLPYGRIVPPPSHKADDSYGHNLLCEWRIRFPGRDKVKLEFKNFKIEYSNGCAYDHLEVYDGPDSNSKLLGRWCGANGPNTLVSSASSITVVFKSDASYNEGGFTLDYSTVCDFEYSEPNGTVSSPLYPRHYPSDRVCHFLISLPVGNAVTLQMLDLDIEQHSPFITTEGVTRECLFDSLMIYDGDTTQSKVLTTLCGNGTVNTLVSSHNYMLLVFKTDVSGEGRGFMANYSSTPINCGGIFRSETGTIKNPTEVAPGSMCRWIISAPAGKVIEIGWSSFLLDRSIVCLRDSIRIFENSTDIVNAGRLGDLYCGDSAPPTMTSSSNIVMIVLNTSRYRATNPRFTAFYRFVSLDESCSGNFYSMNGVIQSPKYPDEYPNGMKCVWTINVPTGRQIRLHVKDFQLEGRLPCRSDYLEIRNGGYETSPLIGKYCGDSIDDQITSFGNQLFLKFVSDGAVRAKGFALAWDGTLTGCGGEISGYSGSIISPNYPSPYGRNVVCVWRVSVSQGSAAIISIVDIDLETHSKCVLDYIEIYDGPTVKSPSLGRYCSSNHPLTITSTGNTMSVKFRSDISRQGRGFHLKFATACNRTIKGYRGVIESPLFPSAFGLPVDCMWTIQAPLGNTFSVVFSHLMIIANKMFSALCNSSGYSWTKSEVCNATRNCEIASLQIDEGTSSSGRTLGKFCESLPPPVVNSTFNEIKVHLKATSFSSDVLFRLEWFVVGCGGVIKGKRSGYLSSPEYPAYLSKPVVCEWSITVDVGSSVAISVIELGIDIPNNCDHNGVQIYGGPDTDSPLITKLCKSLDSSETLHVQASGNKAFVRLHVQDNNKRFKFHAVFDQVSSKCGGFFCTPNGSIHSPNFPQNYDSFDDCEYEISISDNKRINLTFTDFDVDSDANCTSSYVKVYDGGKDTPLKVYTFCQNTIPMPIISTASRLTVRLNAGNKVAKGFKANYSPICGTIANVSMGESGLISYNEYHDTDSWQECIWIIRSDALGQKFTLTFTNLEMRSSSNARNSSILKVLGGEELTSPVFLNTHGGVMPPTMRVPASSIMVSLSIAPQSHVSFDLDYSLLSAACGGTLVADRGVFTSPGYPDNYPLNVECVWLLSNSPGNSLILQIENLDIERTESCNENYLEVRSPNEGGQFIGAYCGSDVDIPRISSNTSLWVKFRSSSGEGKGFLASFSIGIFSELSGDSGAIESPRYPALSIRKSDYKWRIQVPAGSKIELTFNEVYFHGSARHCVDKLTLYDGFDETGTILKVLCGYGETDNVDKIQSSSNVLFLVFHALTFPARFSLTWNKFATTKKTSTEIVSRVNCSQEITIEKDRVVNFQSPGFPYGYTYNVKCDWVFRTDPYYHIVVSFPVVDLERSRYCSADKAEIFDGTSDGSWKSLGVVCHQNDTKREFAGSSSVKVTFTSDVFGNKTGISGIAYSVCGGSVTQDSGMISFNRSFLGHREFPGEGLAHFKYLEFASSACVWNITVKPGKKIELSFSTFNFFVTSGSFCSPTNHLVLRDGFEESSPFIGDTQYCDANKPNDTLVTSSNRLQVSVSEYEHFAQEFQMSFSTKSRSCASSVQLSAKTLKSMIIRSPNYPNMPPPHAECTWQFFAPNGETIHVEFIERFDLAYSTDCAMEYVELRDGSTERSHLIGRYCFSLPPPFVLTEGNALFVKYFTDKQFPNNGFKAKVSLSKCGGTFHDTSTGSIESPGYPEPYDPNTNCVWRFVPRSISVFKLTFAKFTLSRMPGTMRGICNSTGVSVDTLNITVVNEPLDSASWIMCGENITLPSELKGSELIVNFTSFKPYSYIRQPPIGFKISIFAERERCGGSLSLPSGMIESPGYPDSSRGDYCSWKITAPRGRRITFKISDFDLETRQGTFSPSVYVYSDFGYQAKLAKWNGSVPSGTAVSSSSNIMLVTLSQFYPSNHRGFRGHYSSDLPSLCPSDRFDQAGGSFRIAYTQPFACTLEVVSKSSNQTTIVISVVGLVDGGRYEASKCFLSNSQIEISSDTLPPEIFCNVAEAASPFIFMTPYPTVEIKASTNAAWDNDPLNYTVSWKTNNCGGVFSAEGEMSVGIPNYSSNTDCVWKISYPEETTVKIKFISLDLDLTGSNLVDCSSDYLSIHNGASYDSPHILKTCGSTLPQDLVSFSNNLWIHFHSDEAHEGKGFSLKLSPAEEACGGIRHESTGIIESVNYPNGYPNNSNCVYEIRVNKGYHIGLTFIDRFYIESSVNCTKDFIEVFDYIESSQSWSTLGRICGRNTPKVFNSTSSKMKVQFISDGQIQGDGFQAVWSINCGGVVDGSKPGVIHSPNYPRDYDDDLVCNYTVIGANPSSLLFGSFAAFDVESRTTSGCFDMVDVYTIHRRSIVLTDKTKKPLYPNTVYKKDGSYCGKEKPPRFVSFGSFRISFITDGFSEGKGFLLNFGPEDCGGNVTQPGIIKGPSYTNLKYSYPKVNCTWRITAPVGYIIVIKIEELMLATRAFCSQDRLTIWDSKQPTKTNRLATVCGELRQRFGLYRTTSRNAVMELYANDYSPSKKFSADISFVQACGGRLDLLQDGSYEEISSPDSDKNGKYDSSLNCLWTVSTRDSLAISLSFTKFDVQNCTSPYNTSCFCDFVEVFDGVDENAELIGKFCGSNIPNKISSSRSFLAIKFSTDEIQEQSHSGFKAVVKSIQTPCGVRYLNVSEEPQTLTSPGFPNNYPPNLHCSWVLTSNINSKLEIVVEEVDVTLSPGCLSDSLKIRDLSMGFPSIGGLLRSDAGQTKVYMGNDKISSLKPSLSMGSRYPFAASIFCGKRKGVDYYSSSNMVNIKFTSNQGQTARGFKLTYRTAGCGRNYTAPSGRIFVSGLRKRCIITVTAPSPNSTVALYFSEARIYSWFGEGGPSGIKVYDGLDMKPDALLANLGRSWRTPDPVFSNSSTVSIDMFLQRGTITMDITYTTTDRGRGCGGSIYNYGGILTSPLYPRNVRSFANCRWDVSVPFGGAIELEFTEFDLGPKHTCDTDFVEVYDYNSDTEEETLKTTYCGGDTPARITGSHGALVIKYIRSIHNGGTGWVARFMSRNTDPAWPALVGQHLIV